MIPDFAAAAKEERPRSNSVAKQLNVVTVAQDNAHKLS
jgi:hypothetical protein